MENLSLTEVEAAKASALLILKNFIEQVDKRFKEITWSDFGEVLEVCGMWAELTDPESGRSATASELLDLAVRLRPVAEKVPDWPELQRFRKRIEKKAGP